VAGLALLGRGFPKVLGRAGPADPDRSAGCRIAAILANTVTIALATRTGPLDHKGKPEVIRHVITPALPRDHIHPDEISCPECEELRGTNHGDTAGARRHSWPTRTVARALRSHSQCVRRRLQHCAEGDTVKQIAEQVAWRRNGTNVQTTWFSCTCSPRRSKSRGPSSR
jgi:hypothetical protein